MIVHGKIINGKFSERKWDLAKNLTERDGKKFSLEQKLSFGFKDEKDWYATTINNYYWHFSIVDLEKYTYDGTSIVVMK